jgi:predicted signal transduction protein with EAL and GGDEF domain
VLPGASLEIGAKRAEELRAKIEAISVRYLDKNLPAITISVGVAAFPANGNDTQSVLKAADDALYRAKEGGRNRVELPLDTAQPAHRTNDIATIQQLVPDTNPAAVKRSTEPGEFAAE